MIPYGNDWYIFDQEFSNKKAADSAVNNFMNGRFVLVKYCKVVLDAASRQMAEQSDENLNSYQKDYRANYIIDGSDKSYDRYVLRKTTNGWEEIVCLHPQFSSVFITWKEV